MLKVIDISNWQSDIDIYSLSGIDAVICKATEDVNYVDPYCDGFYQAAKAKGLLRGFYHFAGNSNPITEADVFIENTRNYFNDGIPILDWEGSQTVGWVNQFVRRVHDVTGIWPIIYANPWRFNQGGVEYNCGRWVASYPDVFSPSFDQAAGWDCPEIDGTLVGWQFCSDGRVSGYDANLDCSVFYIDAAGWNAYANASGDSTVNPEPVPPEPVPSPAPATKEFHIHMQAISNGIVLDEVTDNNDNAGIDAPMTYLSAWGDGFDLVVSANDLPSLTNPSNINDLENGAVGDGSPITKLYMFSYFPNGDKRIWYRVMTQNSYPNYLSWMKDDIDTGGSSDTFAGDGSPIYRVEAYIGEL